MQKPIDSSLTDDEWAKMSEEEKQKHMDGCGKKKKMDSIDSESVNRFDILPLESRFDTTEDGFLQGTAIVTRTGVFPYQNKDGSIRYELRLPEEVFRADAIETLKLKPVLNGHPREGLITTEIATKYQVGMSGSDPRMDGANLAISFVVTDAKAIKAIKAGKREISCGYRCDTIAEAGEWNGQKYTHVQRNIRYNHIAIVDKGRAGSVARIRMDGALAPLDIEKNSKERTMAEDIMKSINLDGVDYQAEAKVLETLHSYKKGSEELSVKLDSLTSEKTKLEADRDSLKEKLDSVEKELADLKAVHVDSADVAKMVKERVALEAFASKVGVEVKMDESDLDIMKNVVVKQFPKADLANKDATYIKARFDTAVEEFDGKVKNDADIRKINDVKNDKADKPVDYAAARAAYVKNQREAFKAK
jgi:hypothetical protein